MPLGGLWVKIFHKFLDVLYLSLYDFTGPISKTTSGLCVKYVCYG